MNIKTGFKSSRKVRFRFEGKTGPILIVSAVDNQNEELMPIQPSFFDIIEMRLLDMISMFF